MALDEELLQRQVPQSLEAEQAVLGSILIDSRCITEIIGVVLVSSLKSLAENLSKNNEWPDKKKTQQDCD